MEFSWSALWNITDETPDNCQMFLNCRGMSLFLECLKVSRQVVTVAVEYSDFTVTMPSSARQKYRIYCIYELPVHERPLKVIIASVKLGNNDDTQISKL